MTANTTRLSHPLLIREKYSATRRIFNSLRGCSEILHNDYTSLAEQMVLKSTYTTNPLFFSSHYSEEKLNSQHSFSDNDAACMVCHFTAQRLATSLTWSY